MRVAGTIAAALLTAMMSTLCVSDRVNAADTSGSTPPGGRRHRLAIYWKGDNLSGNASAVKWVASRGFTHAVIRGDNFTAPARALCAAGVQPLVDVGGRLRPVSPWANATGFALARDALARDLAAVDGCVAGLSEDVEIPPFPERGFTASGAVDHAKSHNFSDLDDRIGNTQPPSPAVWPSFADWPTPGAHRFTDHPRLTMDDIQFNMATVTVDLTLADGPAGAVELPTATVTEIAQLFTASDRLLTRVDIGLSRVVPPGAPPASAFPPSLSYFVAEVDAHGFPDTSRPVMCAGGNGTRCGVAATEVGLAPEQTIALFLNPEEANLTVGRTYALIVQSQGALAAGGACYALATQSGGKGLVQRGSDGRWASAAGALLARFASPSAAALSRMRPNQLHADWVSFQAAANARFVSEYSALARNLTTPGRVAIYSGYAGASYRVWSGDYYAGVEDAYGVDWGVLAKAGLDIAVAGYGFVIERVNATLAALAGGSGDAVLACGCGGAALCSATGAPLTPQERAANEKLIAGMERACDGVMVWYGGGIGSDSGYTV